MPVCVVNTCGITDSEAAKQNAVISFHRFPEEKTKRARWLKFCGLMNDPSKRMYVCSQHFHRDSFTNNANIQKIVMPNSFVCNRLVKNGKQSNISV